MFSILVLDSLRWNKLLSLFFTDIETNDPKVLMAPYNNKDVRFQIRAESLAI